MPWVGRWWCETAEQINCDHDRDWDRLETGGWECCECGATMDPCEDDYDPSEPDYNRDEFM